ncbi:ABC transporter ATP-binding protein [Nocardioides massiliensis]|uniref:ATP-binding cassette subfamily B protein n=1 Tax=Nocardioides massiliensis TaxID=1325935 RepID=A0ABT9NM02_9ACTN|nr:ABC transporter ATP-binding protein [Nocardioides massiliensis]MDP9821455.1 ATP-binding cassette subfamily B protein [Nocardioides massiliensis]
MSATAHQPTRTESQLHTEPDPLRPPPASAKALWRLRAYVRPHLTAMVLSLLAAGIAIGLSLSIPLVIRELIDGPIADGDRDGLWWLGALAIVLGVLEAAFIWFRRWVQSAAIFDIERSLRRDLYDRLQELPMAFHAKWQSGQLLSRVTTDLTAIRMFAGFGAIFLVVNILQLITVTILLLNMYWPLGLVVAASAVPIVWLSMRFEKAYTVVTRQVQDEQGDVATLVEEAAVGYRVIRSFGRASYAAEGFDRAAGKLYATSLEKVRISARFWSFLGVIPNLAVVVVLLLGARAVGEGEITYGTLVAFVTLMLSLVWPVTVLGVILAMAQEAMTASARVWEIFDTEPAIVGGEAEIADPRGHLRFEGVEFRFPDQSPEEPAILRGVDLDVAPGETVAVVGSTGSGKTALTALVPRLYDVTAGRITIDGVDVRELRLPHLRSLVATAFEEPVLFSMSARENLTLGRPDASEAEVLEAIEVAQAGFVHDLPFGLDTRIGEQGMSLSGGQRQRLALARAVVAKPRILVLDDTLSALDVHTEALVEEALRRVLADATGIVVAHRASTVLLADKVALLQEGRITHVGQHRELLAEVPAYRALLTSDDALAGAAR